MPQKAAFSIFFFACCSRFIRRALLAFFLLWPAALNTGSSLQAADRPFITLASTTSTRDSGLLDFILPQFTQKTGIDVRVVAVGTGQAIKMGEKGDVDVLLVHDRASEDKFVAEGYGAERRDIMHNDFVLVGPADDPAGLRAAASAPESLQKIAEKKLVFVSRGDDSGTHKMELRLWKAAGIDPKSDHDEVRWYKETGNGMGATLNMAASLNAYTLADRGTWVSFQNRRNLAIVHEGVPELLNPYGIMPVNPARFPHIKAGQARRLVDWLTGEEGQKAIADFKINGEALFFPDAAKR